MSFFKAVHAVQKELSHAKNHMPTLTIVFMSNIHADAFHNIVKWSRIGWSTMQACGAQ